MVDVWLPYGKAEVCARIPTRNFLGSVLPREKPGVPDVYGDIEKALKEPIGSNRLDEIAKPESRVVIVADDATRQAPSGLMVPPILDELNAAGVKDENVSIIFACGTHRAVRLEESASLLGKEVVNRVKVLSHNSKAPDAVYIGTTRRHGTKVYLNRIFAEADVKILTGDVGFHYYAGYGGGRKSVLPGVAGEETIRHNHAMFLDVHAKTGVLKENPVHEDMVEAARMAEVDFVLNVVTNSRHEIVSAFAGDLEKVFAADIVVVSPGGSPADVNLFQAYKGIDNALEVVKRGGVVLLVAELPEGHGSQEFYDWMVRFKGLKAVERELGRNFVVGGSKAYYYLKALQKVHIILVSSMPNYYAANIFKLRTARAVNDALNDAFSIAGKNAKVWVLPYGNYTLSEVKPAEIQNASND
jgi:nickel-dependent lactate racemase